MKHEITLTREFSSVSLESRIYLRSNNTPVNTFDDTEQGLKDAQEAYKQALKNIREKGTLKEMLAKEVIETEDK
jgi:hypothetical protein